MIAQNAIVRGNAWSVVEGAQLMVNEAAQQVPALREPVEQLVSARILFDAVPRGSAGAAVGWRAVAAAQRALNAAAHEIPSMAGHLRGLDAALAAYRDAGGPKDRLPGVGGLS